MCKASAKAWPRVESLKFRQKMTRKLVLITLACAFVLAAVLYGTVKHASTSTHPQAPSPNIERRGLVTQVMDGDTIVIGNERVRFVGIDTPELHPAPEPGALEAKQFVEELCFGKEVGLDVDDLESKDRYGRTLAIVYVDIDGSWVNLNAKLLRRGLAEILYIPPSEFNPYRWIES